MKQLTKDQHATIHEWIALNVSTEKAAKFACDFEPSCCDSCADGDHCESDKPKDE